MRDTMMTTIGTCNAGHTSCTRVMWGGLTTAIGGRAGVQLFGVTLGSTGFSSSLARTWTIHNPSNDVYFPSVSILDNGQALATYTVSGSARFASAAYSTFTTSHGSWRDPGREPGPRRVRTASAATSSSSGLWPSPLGRLLGSSDDGELDLLHEPSSSPTANCSLPAFLVDDTCGPSTGHPSQQNISPRVENANKRTFFANWGTSLNKATMTTHHP